MSNEVADESSVFLSTLPAGPRQRLLAAGVVVASAVIFLAAAPFAKVPLTPVPAFIPIYQSALVINDLITAVLLFSQFSILRSRALFTLASAYLFTAFMTVAHTLTFPGLFAPSGLLGAGPQSTAWIYALWHGGFPFGVIAYAWLKDETPQTIAPRRFPLTAVLAGAATVLMVVGGLVLLATSGQQMLPAILLNGRYTVAGSIILTTSWALSLVALLVLWRRKPHSVLDLWLMVVMCAWVFDIALSAVLNGGRFDFGFYAGRIYGLLAASFILLVLLLESGVLYVRLAGAHARTRQKAEDLERLHLQLESRARERTAALDALNNKEEEVRAIVENMLDCIITIDTHGIVRSTNPALERVLGFAAAEVIGQNVSMLMPEPHRGAHDGYLGNYLRTGEARIIGIGRTVEGRHKDGRLIPLELAISEYVVRGERFFIGILRDIRERKRFIAELTQARADAEQANRAKSDFLAAMSHEIRTPMNGVIGMIDVLHQTSLKGYQVEMANLIRDSAFSLLTIIDDILDFSKIEAGKLEIERAPMAVGEVVEKVCGLLVRLAETKGVKLTLFADPEIPRQVLGDALRLRQVLVNLANNAIKFSVSQGRSGRVSVRAVLAERRADRVVVDFHVADNGIGMDEATVARLFTPFSQADVSTTRRFGGTGLGLAISHHLLALMGGKISVQSTPGKGSSFTARVPFLPVPASTAPAGGEPASPVNGLCCLVVGETYTLAANLAADVATYLAAGGATVERASDLATAGERAATLSPGLWVWVIATEDEPPTADQLRAIGGRSEAAPRFVLIGFGGRRRPRAEAPDMVEVDGNALTRVALLKAVAIAAGRAVEEELPQHTGKINAAIRPPSAAEARRTGRLILVAEDNETNQKVILQQLNLLGFAADITCNGKEALERLPEGGYAVLLTDLHMPQMDGYQLAKAIRAEEGDGRHLPIIALSANALKDEAARCRAAGMDDYLSKPAQLADLKAMLEKWQSASTAASKPAAAVDRNVLKALVGDDPDVIQEFLQDFRIGAAKAAQDLNRAFAAGDASEISAVAHKLKSSARSIGALALGALCAELETAGKTGRKSELAALQHRFETEMALVDADLAEV